MMLYDRGTPLPCLRLRRHPRGRIERALRIVTADALHDLEEEAVGEGFGVDVEVFAVGGAIVEDPQRLLHPTHGGDGGASHRSRLAGSAAAAMGPRGAEAAALFSAMRRRTPGCCAAPVPAHRGVLPARAQPWLLTDPTNHTQSMQSHCEMQLTECGQN